MYLLRICVQYPKKKKCYTCYYEKPLVKPIKNTLKMYISAAKFPVSAGFQGSSYDVIHILDSCNPLGNGRVKTNSN